MENEKKYFFDDPKNIKKILHIFYGICVVLFLLDFVIHRHVMHSWENLWGFYPLYGFVGCVVLVLVATWMRTFLIRPEDYYDNEGYDPDEKKPGENVKPSSDKEPSNEVGGSNVDA